jgi:hypothetical protein
MTSIARTDSDSETQQPDQDVPGLAREMLLLEPRWALAWTGDLVRSAVHTDAYLGSSPSTTADLNQ